MSAVADMESERLKWGRVATTQRFSMPSLACVVCEPKKGSVGRAACCSFVVELNHRTVTTGPAQQDRSRPRLA
eukprot:scaffold104593_cov69-Phaeocystis_antarctica.AAC.5